MHKALKNKSWKPVIPQEHEISEAEALGEHG